MAIKTTVQNASIMVEVIKPEDQISPQKYPPTSDPDLCGYRIPRSTPVEKPRLRVYCMFNRKAGILADKDSK